MNLSKNKLKYIRSLKDKKGRSEHRTFLAEGNKLVDELLACMRCQLLVATSSFIDSRNLSNVEEVVYASEKEIEQASMQKTPQQALAVFYQPVVNDNVNFENNLYLALDGIQDPGNLGTIIRLADWYNIKHIFCSFDTVDIYNPKVVQATMGALARVNVHYCDLISFFTENSGIPVYGTLLDGKDIYKQDLTPNGIIVMGNEGNGIRPEVERFITQRLYIPSYPQGATTSESLNVAIATAIVCAEFRRRLC